MNDETGATPDGAPTLREVEREERDVLRRRVVELESEQKALRAIVKDFMAVVGGLQTWCASAVQIRQRHDNLRREYREF